MSFASTFCSSFSKQFKVDEKRVLQILMANFFGNNEKKENIEDKFPGLCGFFRDTFFDDDEQMEKYVNIWVTYLKTVIKNKKLTISISELIFYMLDSYEWPSCLGTDHFDDISDDDGIQESLEDALQTDMSAILGEEEEESEEEEEEKPKPKVVKKVVKK
jgi:hypothetical protein